MDAESGQHDTFVGHALQSQVTINVLPWDAYLGVLQVMEPAELLVCAAVCTCPPLLVVIACR